MDSCSYDVPGILPTRMSGLTRRSSRPLRARDRAFFDVILCSSLAAAERQSVRLPSSPPYQPDSRLMICYNLQCNLIVARSPLALQSFFFCVLPAALSGWAGFLIQSSLREPRTIAWQRLAASAIVVLAVCVGLDAIANVGQLGAPFALILGASATLPILITGVWIAWSAPRWRKLVAPLVVLLIPTAFWMSIQQGNAQSPEQITQRHGDRIVQALQAYHAAQRSYPAALTDLVPKYLPGLPNALTTQGMGWLYQTDSQQYTLGYWHYPSREEVILCRHRSTSPSWDCGVTANTAQGWAPFQVVWTPVPQP
jgi:hypothetical protein